MAHVLGVSMPRSGHHLLEAILKTCLKDKFSYCEFYEAGCCRLIPCKSELHAHVPADHFFLQKSHDHNSRDPLRAPGTYRVVQYRGPVPRSLSNYELHLRNAPDNVRTFRNFLAREALYFWKFYKKWIEPRSVDFFFLPYEELTADPFKAISSLFSFVNVEIDRERIAEGVAASITQRGRDNVPFVYAEVSSHRYAKTHVLANFEDIIFRNCPGYFPTRYFEAAHSERSLIGIIFAGLKAIDAGQGAEAISYMEAASAQDPGNPFLERHLKRARALVNGAPAGAANPSLREQNLNGSAPPLVMPAPAARDETAESSSPGA